LIHIHILPQNSRGWPLCISANVVKLLEKLLKDILQEDCGMADHFCCCNVAKFLELEFSSDSSQPISMTTIFQLISPLCKMFVPLKHSNKAQFIFAVRWLDNLKLFSGRYDYLLAEVDVFPWQKLQYYRFLPLTDN
jgi:hypothetical protein